MVSKEYRLVFIIVITLLVSSCVHQAPAPPNIGNSPPTLGRSTTNTPAKQTSFTPTVEPTSTLTGPVVVYEEYGFRLTLPSGFQTSTLQYKGDMVLFMGIMKESDDNEGYYLPPIGLRVFEKPISADLVTWFGNRQGDCYENGGYPLAELPFIDPVVEKQEPFQGNPALYYESGCWPVPYEMLVDRGRWVIALYYLRDYPINYDVDFNQILVSLELFEPVTQAAMIVSPATPTPAVCLDEAAQPIAVLPRQTPLEVRFISGGNLWVWSESIGSAQQISKTGDAQAFSFSADGQVIAFTRGKSFSQTELWSINLDGSDPRLLVSADQLHAIVGEPTTSEHTYTDNVSFITWIGNTHTLGFEVLRSYDAIGGCCETGGTWQVDADTGNLSTWSPPEEILTEQGGGLFSPDGKQIAWVAETGLTLVNADGSNRRECVLVYPYVPQMEGGGFVRPQVSWAPDSQSLVVITYPENMWEENIFTTWYVPVDGTAAQKLGEFSGYSFSASPSPDRRYLAYRNVPETTSNDWKLHLATFDGSKDFVYAQGHLMDFWGWSPDGVHFVFGQGSTRLPYLGNVCGGAVPLMDPPIFPLWHLTWVDAERFVFVAGGAGPSEGELRLGTVGKGSVQIGSFQGDYATYEIKQDQ